MKAWTGKVMMLIKRRVLKKYMICFLIGCGYAFGFKVRCWSVDFYWCLGIDWGRFNLWFHLLRIFYSGGRYVVCRKFCRTKEPTAGWFEVLEVNSLSRYHFWYRKESFSNLEFSCFPKAYTKSMFSQKLTTLLQGQLCSSQVCWSYSPVLHSAS